MLRPRAARMSPPSARSSTRIQPTKVCGRAIAGVPNRAIALVHVVANGKSGRGGLLHVVGERAHAGEDFVTPIVAGQARGDVPALAARVRVPLRLHDHRRTGIQRTKLDGRQQDHAQRADLPRTVGQQADAQTNGHGRSGDEWDHISNSKRVPLHEGVPGKGRRSQRGQCNREARLAVCRGSRVPERPQPPALRQASDHSRSVDGSPTTPVRHSSADLPWPGCLRRRSPCG